MNGWFAFTAKNFPGPHKDAVQFIERRKTLKLLPRDHFHDSHDPGRIVPVPAINPNDVTVHV